MNFPYFQSYEDLKPSSSPSPTPSTTPGASRTSDIDAKPVASKSTPLSEPSSTTTKKEAPKSEMKKTEPLSPYIA